VNAISRRAFDVEAVVAAGVTFGHSTRNVGVDAGLMISRRIGVDREEIPPDDRLLPFLALARGAGWNWAKGDWFPSY